MLRLRLASLALTCAFLVTLSGCGTFRDEGPLFPRLHSVYGGGGGGGTGLGRGWLASHRGECGCQSQAPAFTDSASLPGATWTAPLPNTSSSLPIPITNVPATQPPHTFKIPQAQPTPFNP